MFVILLACVMCLDVDECQLQQQPCSQLCVNTAGSYRCDCVTGYQLRPDGHTCKALGKFTVLSSMSRGSHANNSTPLPLHSLHPTGP